MNGIADTRFAAMFLTPVAAARPGKEKRTQSRDERKLSGAGAEGEEGETGKIKSVSRKC